MFLEGGTPSHYFMEIIYRFVLYGGPLIVIFAIVAAMFAALLRWQTGRAFKTSFQQALAVLSIAAAPILFAAGQWWRTWELEKINERCGEMGCESDYYFGSAKGTAIIGLLLATSLYRRKIRNTE